MLSPLAATVARDHPDVSEDVVQALVEATTKEIWALAITRCLEFREQRDILRWDCLRSFASEFHGEGVAA